VMFMRFTSCEAPTALPARFRGGGIKDSRPATKMHPHRESLCFALDRSRPIG
jgi:hypothetical protein